MKMMERLGIHGLFAMVNILFSVLFGVVCLEASERNCSIPSSNTTCRIGEYFDTIKQVCSICKVCHIGKGVQCGCRYHSNTKCEWCSKGTFSKYERGNRYCTACTKCRPYEVEKQPCNKTDDAICSVKAKPTRRTSNVKMYQTIIGVLGAILFVTIVMIIYVVVVVKKRRGLNAPYLGRDDFSNASEAQCLDGSSVSDFEDSRWKRERLKFNGSSFSSLDSRCKDSVQSSALSSDHHSGSERPPKKTLQSPDVLIQLAPATVYQDLGRLLNPAQPYRDWQTLAGKLGKTQLEVENLKLSTSFDYTEKILVDWCTRNPEASVGGLYSILLSMGREDAAAVLLNYDKETTTKQKRVETPV